MVTEVRRVPSSSLTAPCVRARSPSGRRARCAGAGRQQRAAYRRARRLLTDETLTSVDDPRVVAAGDSACAVRQPLRMAAHQLGRLGPRPPTPSLRRIAGAPPARFETASREHASASAARPASAVHPERRHRGELLRRRPTRASVKEAICKGTLWAIRREARKPGTASGSRAARGGNSRCSNPRWSPNRDDH